MKKHDNYLSVHGIKNLVPSSLSDQRSRTYKGRLFHFLNETNYFFLKLLSKSFYTELLPTPFFFIFESKCLPVIVRTQLLCMVSKEKETDRWTLELSYISMSSNPTVLKRKQISCYLFAFYSYLETWVLNLCLTLGQGTETETEVAIWKKDEGRNVYQRSATPEMTYRTTQ